MKLTCELSSSFGIMSGSEVGDILFLQLGVTVYELEPKKKWVFGSGGWKKHNIDF